MIAHDVLTYLSALSIQFPATKIKIRPYLYNCIDRDTYNPDFPFEMREGNKPTVTSEQTQYDENEYYSDFVKYEKPVEERVPAIQVLSLYSVEPDWGMDSDLELSHLQSLMGGSQGYRHLRYTLFGLRAGIAHKRAVHFSKLAGEAFRRDDQYWGIRFSARAIHYIEDVLTPVHTKPFTEMYFIKNLTRLKDLYYTTYNYHLNFERFVAYHLWHGSGEFIRWIVEAEPLSISNLHAQLMKLWRKMRNLFYPIFRECEKLWGDSMKTGLIKLLKKDITKINPPRGLILPIELWLKHSAGFVKGYIAEYVLPYMKGVLH